MTFKIRLKWDLTELEMTMNWIATCFKCFCNRKFFLKQTILPTCQAFIQTPSKPATKPPQQGNICNYCQIKRFVLIYLMIWLLYNAWRLVKYPPANTNIQNPNYTERLGKSTGSDIFGLVTAHWLRKIYFHNNGVVRLLVAQHKLHWFPNIYSNNISLNIGSYC